MSACADFPEDFFVPSNPPAYDSAIRAGQAMATQHNVAIVGCVRQIGELAYRVTEQVKRTMDLFGAARAFILENDSTDCTPAAFEALAAADSRVLFRHATFGKRRWEATRDNGRMADMAYYRTLCQQMVRDSGVPFDAVVVVDLDLAGGWSYEGLWHTWSLWADWDAIHSNGLAWMHERWIQYDAFAWRQRRWDPLNYAQVHPIVPQRGSPLIPKLSANGGMSVYKYNAYMAGTYAGGDCEHVKFHRSMHECGFTRRFVNPSQITLYSAVVDGMPEPW